MPTFGMFSEMHSRCSCGTNQKASSSKECWVHTHISFQNTVKLRLWIFWSCVCNGKAAQ